MSLLSTRMMNYLLAVWRMDDDDNGDDSNIYNDNKNNKNIYNNDEFIQQKQKIKVNYYDCNNTRKNNEHPNCYWNKGQQQKQQQRKTTKGIHKSKQITVHEKTETLSVDANDFYLDRVCMRNQVIQSSSTTKTTVTRRSYRGKVKIVRSKRMSYFGNLLNLAIIIILTLITWTRNNYYPNRVTVPAFFVVAVDQTKPLDLYQLLGVTKKATTKEIKSAYRKKALNTHPDKNRDKPPEQAAEEFRQVVHAFEILSDDQSRKRYDRTGQTDATNNNNNNGYGGGYGGYGGGGFHYQFHWNYYGRPIKLKDKFEVKQAMSRVLHVVSLDQLKTIMLDENELLEKNLLICFTTAKVEQYVDEEMVFPYPFAGMSTQGIWWEDLLQTVKIRFHKSNELTKFFGVTAHEIDSTSEPVFVFGKRGKPLDDEAFMHFDKIQTRDRQKFETWMWERIEVVVVFVNQHTHPIEIYWVHGTTAHMKEICQPNHRCVHTTMLSHEWYVRDARVDTHDTSPGRHKLTNESSLGSFKILSDQHRQEIVIKTKCFDLSGHCTFYAMRNECPKNPGFMHHYCKKSCNLCSKDDNDQEL